MVQVVGLKTYGACFNSAVADGKPHKRIEVDLAAEADIKPLKLIQPDGVAAKSFDYAAKESPGTSSNKGRIWVTDVPIDYPGRDQFDQTTAYAASSKGVPAFECEIDREYYLNTATDMTGYDEGQILVCANDGDVAKPDDDSPDAVTVTVHAFVLMYAVSATQIVIKYKGLIAIDTT